MKTIGVLALQGAFKEHIKQVESLGVRGLEVRTLDQLNQVDALILPGGESTTMGKLLVDFNLKQPLIDRINGGMPVWGTCAGLILLANKVEGQDSHLNVMDISVKRNAYGRQLGSFVTEDMVPEVSSEPVPLVFIRAPYIAECDSRVKVLHRVDGNIVAARQNKMLATSFHPELTPNLAFLNYFVNMID